MRGLRKVANELVLDDGAISPIDDIRCQRPTRIVLPAWRMMALDPDVVRSAIRRLQEWLINSADAYGLMRWRRYDDAATGDMVIELEWGPNTEGTIG